MKCIMLLLFVFFTGCTLHVTEAPTDDADYCWASYYCSYYDVSGHLQSGYFCYEEIEENMTCK